MFEKVTLAISWILRDFFWLASLQLNYPINYKLTVNGLFTG